MMKRILACLLVLCMTACVPNTSGGSAAGSQTVAVDDAVQQLSDLGSVEMIDGVPVVTLTLPAEYASQITLDDLKDSSAYVDATINEDGSVTYKLTKEQYENMYRTMKAACDKAIKYLEDSGQFSIKKVEHSDSYAEFKVTLEGEKLGLIDSLSALTLYMYGGLMGMLKGKVPEHVTVSYYSADGKFIKTADSANILP